MKPLIPKEPMFVNELKNEDIHYLTNLVFDRVVTPQKCDALFVFSGTHPGHWEKAIEAYKGNYAGKIIVTGGRSTTGTPHVNWEGNKDTKITEAQIIISYLQKAGIPSDIILFEEESTNTLENVLYAKEIVDFTSIHTLMVVCKSHVAGRQIRTLHRHLPKWIEYIPFTFNTVYQDIEVNRENWMDSEVGRKRVWGEYLRIEKYGKLGHLTPL